MAFLVLLEALSPVERAVFMLPEVLGYGYPDVARITGKSELNYAVDHFLSAVRTSCTVLSPPLALVSAGSAARSGGRSRAVLPRR